MTKGHSDNSWKYAWHFDISFHDILNVKGKWYKCYGQMRKHKYDYLIENIHHSDIIIIVYIYDS